VKNTFSFNKLKNKIISHYERQYSVFFISYFDILYVKRGLILKNNSGVEPEILEFGWKWR
jgi:hypothetical protein